MAKACVCIMPSVFSLTASVNSVVLYCIVLYYCLHYDMQRAARSLSQMRKNNAHSVDCRMIALSAYIQSHGLTKFGHGRAGPYHQQGVVVNGTERGEPNNADQRLPVLTCYTCATKAGK